MPFAASRTSSGLLAIALVLANPILPLPAFAQPSAGDVDTITVYGRAMLNEEAALTPGAVTVIDTSTLRERNAGHMADLLRYVPGVWATSASGTDGVFFSSRGSNLDSLHYDFNGMKMLQDGLPVTAADGNNHNRLIDPLSASSATVARGANAMKFGASTLGGAIDFATPTARGGARSEVFFNGGSHGQAQLRGTVGGELNERTDALVTFETKGWDGYRDHNEQRRYGMYANVGWQLSDRTSTRLYATYVSNDQELAGVLTRAQFEANPTMAEARAVTGHYQLNVDAVRLASKTTVDLDDNRSIEFGLSFEEQSLFHPIVDRVMVPIGGELVEVFSLLIDTEQRDLGTMLRYRHRVGNHDFLVGMNYGVNTVKGGQYRNLGGQPNGLTTIVDNAANSLEVFAMDRWQVADRWMIELAAQGVSARREIRNTTVSSGALRNPSGRFTRFNPRAGFIRSIGNHVSLYGNLSSLYEPPTNYQLEDEASGSDAILNAMRGTVLEVGARGEGTLLRDGVLFWDVALYRAGIRDAILSIDDPEAPGTSLSANMDRTTHAGLEAIVGARLPVGSGGGAIAPLVSVTVNDFRFDNDAVYGNRTLPAAPGHVVRGEVLYRLGNGVFVGPTFDIVDSRYADFMNTYRIDSYRLFGLRAGWTDDRWRIFGELRNAADTKYVAFHNVRNIAAPDDAILHPGEPRSVYFGVQLRF